MRITLYRRSTARFIDLFHIFFALPLFLPIAFYHTPGAIGGCGCAAAHITLHTVGSIMYRIAVFRFFLCLPLVHVLFQDGFRILRRRILLLGLGGIHAGFNFQVPHDVTPHQAW